MKSVKILLPAVTAIALILSFSQCRNKVETGQIAFNAASAAVHHISLYNAALLTSNFKEGEIKLLRQLKDSTYLRKRFSLPLAEEFNRDAIAELLNQKGAGGVRIYLGQDNAGTVRLVLVATDAGHNDITGPGGGGNGKVMRMVSSGDSQTGIVLEAGQRCPTLCSTNSELNK